MDDLLKEIEYLKKENDSIKKRLFLLERREKYRKIKTIISIIVTILIMIVSVFYFLTLKNSINEIVGQLL